jgi:hypothetical protein
VVRCTGGGGGEGRVKVDQREKKIERKLGRESRALVFCREFVPNLLPSPMLANVQGTRAKAQQANLERIKDTERSKDD